MRNAVLLVQPRLWWKGGKHTSIHLFRIMALCCLLNMLRIYQSKTPWFAECYFAPRISLSQLYAVQLVSVEVFLLPKQKY